MATVCMENTSSDKVGNLDKYGSFGKFGKFIHNLNRPCFANDRFRTGKVYFNMYVIRPYGMAYLVKVLIYVCRN